MPRPAKQGARAFRMHVDECYSDTGFCPFVDTETDFCTHPLAPPYPHLAYEENPPEWCPLRGSVTMISGPPIDQTIHDKEK